MRKHMVRGWCLAAAVLASGTWAMAATGSDTSRAGQAAQAKKTQARPAAKKAPTPVQARKPQPRKVQAASPTGRKPAATARKATPPRTAATPSTRPAARTAVAATGYSTDTEARLTRPGDHRFTITHGGVARSYRVHLPPQYNVAQPAPLLVVLHGAGGDMNRPADDGALELASRADREGFITVHPAAQAPAGSAPGAATWNTGPGGSGADDASFVAQVVMNVFRQASVDRERIYATGVSQGAGMALRLACDLPTVFKAVVAVGGDHSTTRCEPGQPVSVLHLQARSATAPAAAAPATRRVSARANDTAAMGAAPAGASPDAAPLAPPQAVAEWAQRNGCTAKPRRILDVGGDYCESYAFCRGQAEVQRCVTDTLGASAISASDRMWGFLGRP